jgi:vacuolar-type H+-ATPase subunit H
MSDESSREELLNAIKKAEKEGAQREERARAGAAKVHTEAQTECARMIEQAEKDGRALTRQAVESARAEFGDIRAKQLERTDALDREVEEKADERMQAVAELILRQFKKEFDAEN